MDGMKQTIQNELEVLEAERDVRVLLSVESGSRAWGMASPDSDYDVRFVYVRPISEYLRLENTRDTIEWKLDEKLDITGWDLQKFLRLLRGSNPTAFEWLSSHIVYREDADFAAVRAVAASCFAPAASAFHYLGIVRGNDQKDIARESDVRVKKYLYAIRGILAARWALDECSPVPMLIADLVEAKLEPAMHPTVEHLLRVKSALKEQGRVPHDEALEEWIDSNLESLMQRARMTAAPQHVPWSDLDAIFQGIVLP
jgi:predicted nucleotidyltransferase